MSDRTLVAREYGMQSYTVDVVVTVWVVVSVTVISMGLLFVKDMNMPTAIIVARAMFVISFNRLNYMC